MAIPAPADFLKLAPLLRDAPSGQVWSLYDREADTLYLNFRPAAEATDSELTDDDLIIRYAGDDLIGITILHASTRQ
ncbi:MAG: DUF2283 domain-containing protein [Dehalococcoidia bacterium]